MDSKKSRTFSQSIVALALLAALGIFAAMVAAILLAIPLGVFWGNSWFLVRVGFITFILLTVLGGIGGKITRR